jgi:signal transduction histidine kinase
MPLGDLLRQLAEAISGRTRLEVHVEAEGRPEKLPPDVHVALYRIAQEALNNVVKHAQAEKAYVRLKWGTGSVSLRVSDNGRGFDPAAVPTGHLGLGIMRERAASIGAALSIDSGSSGTAVRVDWRLEERN